jgi:Cys-rich protein (TIGR01571 family)
MAIGAYWNASSIAAADAASADVLLAQMTAYNTAIDSAKSRTALWLQCNGKFNKAIAGTLVLLFLLLLYGGARRATMRKKFGLQGNTLNDVCSWIFCAWAALCQETRTLRQNGVDGGAWGGEQATRLLAPGSVEMSSASSGAADAAV